MPFSYNWPISSLPNGKLREVDLRAELAVAGHPPLDVGRDGDQVRVAFTAALSPGDEVAVEAVVLAHTGEAPSSPTNDPANFGEYRRYAENPDYQSTGSSAWLQNLLCTMDGVSPGQYRIEWYFEWGASNSWKTFEAEVLVDGVVVGALCAEIRGNMRMPAHGFAAMPLLAGDHTVELRFRAPDSGWYDAIIYRSRIEAWRVG